MSLISQAGPSYGIRSEITQNKSGHNGFCNVANIMETSKHRASSIGFPPLSRYSSKTAQLLHVDGSGIGCKRGHKVIVAASPPTEDAVIATEPLTKEDLVGYLASGCKPKENWRFNF